MPSFDIVSEVNQVEVRNAVDQTNKEVSTRFDFKGSDARVEINEKEKSLSVFADDDFKLSQVRDVLTAKLAKRGVESRCIVTRGGQEFVTPLSVAASLAKNAIPTCSISMKKRRWGISNCPVRRIWSWCARPRRT